MTCKDCKYEATCIMFEAKMKACKEYEVKRLESIVTSHLNKVFEYNKNQLPIV